ncbi:hypothetical protein MPSD_07660 [Mycobacterium pseudoshottsii JCM 15466]|nr:hypothetical protein MPSD_07660 [Mycobacterium pseudoshottsii JCM 15466]
MPADCGSTRPSATRNAQRATRNAQRATRNAQRSRTPGTKVLDRHHLGLIQRHQRADPLGGPAQGHDQLIESGAPRYPQSSPEQRRIAIRQQLFRRAQTTGSAGRQHHTGDARRPHAPPFLSLNAVRHAGQQNQ